MRDSTRKARFTKAEKTAELRTPRWGPEGPVRVVFEGYGEPVDPARREAELTRFVGWMAAHGWTQVHRMPGAVLLARTYRADGGAAMGVGAVGVATGAAVGGSGLAGALIGIVMIFCGFLLTFTIIGAYIGIPMIAAGIAAFGGGAAVAAAGGAAVGIGGAASQDQVQRLQAWSDETGRIFTKGA
ncbi:hypothetical protein [Streptomyces flavofungini]|uniref:Integral membrane protein n=1 Tax=Streptomyces flavofungini TaxID=68200 RepID=A0ABS0XFG0_9ACTN|nr:hypothetical protein [Streptomyces flavofungini]MBJ3811935.1 hypothetical protein [Streptomyces flavofungini]GHC52334.1 hypothetical protein GCM10010349_17910 [Streptomyces flavofungini]